MIRAGMSGGLVSRRDTVCANCGEAVFSRETTERVRRMVHGEAKPVKSIQMDVFAYTK